MKHLLTISAFCFFCLCIFAHAGATPACAAKDFIGKITSIKGSAFAIAQTKKRALKQDSPIYSNETLVTDQKSGLKVKFTDDTTLILGENTRMRLAEYYFDVKKPSTCKLFFNALVGLARMVTGQIVKHNPDNFTVSTPIASVGIRGTDFFIDIQKDGEKIGVSAMDSNHEVRVSTKVDAITIKKAGFYTRVSPDGKLSPLARIPKQVTNQVIRAQQGLMRKSVRPRVRPRIR